MKLVLKVIPTLYDFRGARLCYGSVVYFICNLCFTNIQKTVILSKYYRNILSFS